MHHTCSECGKPIGLMANEFGQPVRFRCVHTGRWADAHVVVSRDTPPLPRQYDPREVLRDTMISHGADPQQIKRALAHAR